jgi:hypothetical protein
LANPRLGKLRPYGKLWFNGREADADTHQKLKLVYLPAPNTNDMIDYIENTNIKSSTKDEPQ